MPLNGGFKCQKYFMKLEKMQTPGIEHLNASLWHLKLRHLAFIKISTGYVVQPTKKFLLLTVHVNKP